MSNINKIRLSGQTYNIQDENASKTVELTQAQYDALSTKDPNTFYVITDAQGADLSNYYTKSETSGATQISTALNAKQDTLVSGTNIKTINNESILGSGNINIQGGGGNVVQTTGTSTTDVMSQDAVTTQLNGTVKLSNLTTYYIDNFTSNEARLTVSYHRFDIKNAANGYSLWYGKINNQYVCKYAASNSQPSGLMNLSVVETSAIATSISSSSTDTQIPSAKAVYDTIGNINTILESI